MNVELEPTYALHHKAIYTFTPITLGWKLAWVPWPTVFYVWFEIFHG